MNNAEEYYNSTSKDYVAKWDLSENGLKKPANYYRLEIIKAMFDCGKIEPKDQIVEIGCGTGLVLQELVKIKKPIYATDISTEMLYRVKDSLLKSKKVDIVENFSNLSDSTKQADVVLMQNDLLSLNLPSSYFDKILSMEVLRYVDDVPKALKNVHGVMKNDSVFVFTITNFWSFSLFPIKYTLRKIFKKVDSKKELLQYFVTEGSIKKSLRDAGFSIVSFKKLNLLTFNPLIEKIVRTSSFAKKVQIIDKFLEKIPLINKLFDTFIIAVKRLPS